jgi:hypothetical protein
MAMGVSPVRSVKCPLIAAADMFFVLVPPTLTGFPRQGNAQPPQENKNGQRNKYFH